MSLWDRIENIATIVATVVLVSILYYMSNSWHSLWGLLLMFNINYVEKRRNEAV